MVHEFNIDPASLIHALQNHDELTLELVHFWTKHANDTYTFEGQAWPGTLLREHLRDTLYSKLTGDAAPYNLRFVANGVACTTISVITAALGIRDLDAITPEQKQLIQRVHLLLVMYNAYQPGVFALSGWDLVGALPLSPESVSEMINEGDTRWIERGAYDLIDVNPDAQHSSAGLPKARMLYGTLNQQLEDPDSFANQLKHLLAVRQAHGLFAARQTAIPDVQNPGLLVMVHELPDQRGTQVTALNFGPDPLEETILLENVQTGPVVDMLNGRIFGDLPESGELFIRLEGFQGQSLRIVGAVPSI
jgi:trehalose synthase